MNTVRLASAIDFEGWREAARHLLRQGVHPEAVTWTAGEADSLFDDDAPATPVADTQDLGDAAIRVPPAFIALAQSVILHRDADRFGLLYRILWRLRDSRHLLDDPLDADIARARLLQSAVRRDLHKMKAFVRFRELKLATESRFLAWFEPEHHIALAVAPFFARRFTNMAWTIVTPEATVQWDGTRLLVGPGGTRADVPTADASEDLWRAYYRSIFNPARLKEKAMLAEMPAKYWKNLPEAEAIAPMIAQAQVRTGRMIEREARPPQRATVARPTRPPIESPAAGSIGELAAAVRDCRSCGLWEKASHAVFGEGPPTAKLMLVGEQPGDQEDSAGRPFVGPAGKMLDSAMMEAGLDRRAVYLTNAVKHFSFELRGTRRLHKTPAQREIQACLQWLDREIGFVKPDLIVALGATAARAVLGRSVAITRERGQFVTRADGARVLVTFHPAYLLRLPDDAKAAAWATWVADLKMAAGSGSGDG